MSEHAITLKNISFQYPRNAFRFTAEEFTLKTGEICLVEGNNGSGKSTLLKLCAGILKCEGMGHTVFGNDATNFTLGQMGKYVGYLFQEPSKQIFTATVWDEMTFIGSVLDQNPDEIAKKAIELLDRFSLKHLAKRSTYRLSRGEKQRLALASILMQDIKYLMLDEPTTGLDVANRKTLYTIMDELVKSGLGIAVISHDTELFSRFPEARIVKVSKGGIVNEKC